PLVRHHDYDDLGNVDARLESHARGGEIVERRAGPRSAVARDEHATTARAAEDEARPHDLRRDQHPSGAVQILLDRGLVGIAQEVSQCRARVRDESLRLVARWGGRAAADDQSRRDDGHEPSLAVDPWHKCLHVMSPVEWRAPGAGSELSALLPPRARPLWRKSDDRFGSVYDHHGPAR